MAEAIEALRVLSKWMFNAAIEIVRFVAWWNIAKEYIAMVNMLEARKDFYKEADQPPDRGGSGGDIGCGIGNGVEGFKARDERFFRLFLWFFVNVLLVALLR